MLFQKVSAWNHCSTHETHTQVNKALNYYSDRVPIPCFFLLDEVFHSWENLTGIRVSYLTLLPDLSNMKMVAQGKINLLDSYTFIIVKVLKKILSIGFM